MKRCPHCSRDYTNDTLSFCLDDGAALLDGPALRDEPATAVLPRAELSGESPTRVLDQPITNDSAGKGREPDETRARPGITPKNGVMIAAIGLALVTVLGVGSYWIYGGGAAKEISSIAVMPFVNDSGDEDLEYLSDGMTETLINNLSNIPNLSVKARNSVFRYKGKEIDPKAVGRELQVEAILLGRVLERNGDLRLNLELIDASSDNVLWSESFNRKMTDVVSLQTDIASIVSEKLKLKLTGEEQQKLTKKYTTDNKAYRAYLQGQFYYNKLSESGLKKSIEYFEEAVRMDPNFALAYSGLSDSYRIMPGVTETGREEYVPKAKAAAEKAVELDPNLAQARTSLGMIKFLDDWDFAGAEREFLKAIELNPKEAGARRVHSSLLASIGRVEESEKQAYAARDLDPLSLHTNLRLGVNLYDARKFVESQQQFQQTVDMFPENGNVRYFLALTLARTGKYDSAYEECQKAEELDKTLEGCDAFVDVISGRDKDVSKITSKFGLSNEEDYFIGAILYALLGDKDSTFDLLEKMYKIRHPEILRLRIEPSFDLLRNDPRYKDLENRIGFPE